MNQVQNNDETVFIERTLALSSIELIKIGQDLARMDANEEELLNKKRALVSDFGAKIQENKSNMKEAIRLIRDEERTEEVLCTWDYDYKAGTVVYSSTETGELILERPMNNDERQLKLFEDQQKKKKQDEGVAH